MLPQTSIEPVLSVPCPPWYEDYEPFEAQLAKQIRIHFSIFVIKSIHIYQSGVEVHVSVSCCDCGHERIAIFYFERRGSVLQCNAYRYEGG